MRSTLIRTISIVVFLAFLGSCNEERVIRVNAPGGTKADQRAALPMGPHDFMGLVQGPGWGVQGEIVWPAPPRAGGRTPFGSTLAGQCIDFFGLNPDSACEENGLLALMRAKILGDHASFVWSWGNRDALPHFGTMVQQIHNFGLESFLQMGSTFLGDPAPPLGYPKSFGDSLTRARFLTDVKTLAETHPTYLNLSTEVNLMYYFNNAEFQHFKSLYKEAYRLVKAISPETKAGTSYLYNLFLWDAEIGVPMELGPHDFIGFTTYPGWMARRGLISSPTEMSSHWYGQLRMVYPNMPIVFSEVGWASRGSGSLAQQADFIGELPRLMRDVRPELVTWTLLHDVDFFHPFLLNPDAKDFLDSLGVDYEQLFQDFNSMGIHERDGSPKPAWLRAVTLDFSD